MYIKGGIHLPSTGSNWYIILVKGKQQRRTGMKKISFSSFEVLEVADVMSVYECSICGYQYDPLQRHTAHPDFHGPSHVLQTATNAAALPNQAPLRQLTCFHGRPPVSHPEKKSLPRTCASVSRLAPVAATPQPVP